MRLLALSAGLLFLAASCMDDPVGVAPQEPLVCDFVTVWEHFEENYPELTIKDIDWENLYGEYLPAAEQAESAQELMTEAVLPMLARLEDVHVWLYPPEGGRLWTYEPDIEPNYRLSYLCSNYLSPNGFTGWFRGVGYCPPESLPYLSLKTWIPNLNIEKVDEFVGLCQDEPAIIIDVRMNGGGNNLFCDDVAGRFADTTSAAWLIRSRTGPDYDDCSHQATYNMPRGPLQYDGTVILLIGEYCASSTEDFVLRMSQLSDVVLLGDTTMGAVCCPYFVDLPNGWTFTAISWSLRTVSEEPVEWFGIAPDLYVDAPEELLDQGVDPVLEYAMDMLEDY